MQYSEVCFAGGRSRVVIHQKNANQSAGARGSVQSRFRKSVEESGECNCVTAVIFNSDGVSTDGDILVVGEVFVAKNVSVSNQSLIKRKMNLLDVAEERKVTIGNNINGEIGSRNSVNKSQAGIDRVVSQLESNESRGRVGRVVCRTNSRDEVSFPSFQRDIDREKRCASLASTSNVSGVSTSINGDWIIEVCVSQVFSEKSRALSNSDINGTDVNSEVSDRDVRFSGCNGRKVISVGVDVQSFAFHSKQNYGVVFDSDGLRVDSTATGRNCNVVFAVGYIEPIASALVNTLVRSVKESISLVLP
jgi:hypothetical protein